MAGIIFAREKTLQTLQLHQPVSRAGCPLRLDARLLPVGSGHGAVLICVNCPVSSESELVPAGQAHR